jgi:hypothetical protein
LSIEDDEDLDLEDDILSSDVIDSLDTDDFEKVMTILKKSLLSAMSFIL